jgi:hypothetical protein
VDDSSYAGLLAQVIPVVLLAVILEIRGLHDVWLKVLGAKKGSGKRGEAAGRPDLGPMLLVQMGGYLAYAGVLIFLETAALIVARGGGHGLARVIVGSDALLALLAGGLGLVIAFHAVAVSRLYQQAGALEERGVRGFRWVLRVIVVLVTVGVWALNRW